MAIVKNPKLKTKPSADIDAATLKFIEGAPDGGATDAVEEVKQRYMRNKRVGLSITVPPANVDALDRLAKRMGATRGGLINQAIGLFLEAHGEGQQG